LVALAIAAAVLLAHESYARRSRPRSVTELVDRLRQSGVPVCVVPAARSNPALDNGAYLCEGERAQEELVRAPRAALCQAAWAGVVYAQRWPHDEDAFADMLRQWQNCSARVGDVLLFGDPELLRRIVDAVRR
jgi:hypothetical protein